MSAKWKTVRVFISSTFRDMHSERDHLVKVVFPTLRERLQKYRIHLIDIDLRWGVTKEQSDNDQVLEVCLRQIDECHPFFVGLLGELYGYVPRGLSEEAVSKYGWIQHQMDKSITELEILYGVLREQKMRPRALFFFRDPAFIRNVPEALRSQLMERNPHLAEKLKRLKQVIREAGLPIPPLENYSCRFAGLSFNLRMARPELSETEARSLEELAEARLITADKYSELDDRIKAIVNELAVVRLEGMEEFGRGVQERLWQSIKAEYDLPDVPVAITKGERNELTDELNYHEQFMESRLRVYIGRENVYDDLAAFASGDETDACLLTGPSGSGKSAALARFATAYAERNPDTLVIPHFVGASPASTNLRQILRRFCLILAREFRFESTPQKEDNSNEPVPAEIPQTVNELVPLFREFLQQVPKERRVIIVLDALDQLDESDNAQALYWLPRQWPTHVKLIVSCITNPGKPERVLDAFNHRPCRCIELAALTGDERLEIIRTVPSLSAKMLDSRQIGLLLDNPASCNPLFLLVALEELRGFGSFEHLTSRIRAFPSEGDTVTAIFTQVIERLEDDFGADLTRQIFSLLASARRGLSDRELLELIEGVGKEIDQSESSLFPVLRQIRAYLLNRGELNDFYHRNFLKAVREKYLAEDNLRATAHQRLADHFRTQDYWMESLEAQRARAKRLPPTPRPANIRKVDELPWQVLEVAKLLGKDDPKSPYWDAVADLLTDWQFLEAKAEADPTGLYIATDGASTATEESET